MQKNILKSIILGLLSTSAASGMEVDDLQLTTGLALEGRGMEALIPAVILREMEADTNLPVHEMFDVMGGTSSGALLGMAAFSPFPPSMSEIVDRFKQDGPAIFTKDPYGFCKRLGRSYATAWGVTPPLAGAGLKAGFSVHNHFEMTDLGSKAAAGAVSDKGLASTPKVSSLRADEAARDAFFVRHPELGDKKCRGVFSDLTQGAKRESQKIIDYAIQDHENDVKADSIKAAADFKENAGWGIQSALKDAAIGLAIGAVVQGGIFTLNELFWNTSPKPRYIPEVLPAFLYEMLSSVQLKKFSKQVLVPVSRPNGTIYLFDSERAKEDRGFHNYLGLSIAHATLCHPADFTYRGFYNFDNTDFNEFLDLGLSANNPTEVVRERLTEIQKNPERTFLLSLGIGELARKYASDIPVTKGGMYRFPKEVREATFLGAEGNRHAKFRRDLGENYVRKQGEFVDPRTGSAVSAEILEEFEQKGIEMAGELQEAGIFRKLAENRSLRKEKDDMSVVRSVLLDEDYDSYEELTGIRILKKKTASPDENGEKEDTSGREKEAHLDRRKKN